MSLNRLVLKSMQKNMRHYFLYFFALIFSVTLYFSFQTLQHNDAVAEAARQSGSASSGLEAATYMLYFIILFFVLYANHLFMKRRSKEVGLYQLIGMSKSLVIRLIAYENILLFIGAVLMGMAVGLLSSRFFTMILLKILKFEAVVSMTIHTKAVTQTILLFGCMLLIILIQLIFIIQKSSLLSLFNVTKQADERVKPFRIWSMCMGAIGIALIAYGYYKSSKLFTLATNNLMLEMLIILGATIGGTYFVFRFSVSFIMNILRLRKKGFLNLGDVMALTPIMHRMKGNAKSLTLITVLTAVSLAITTLAYISYYSAEKTSTNQVPADYTAFDGNESKFLSALDEEGINYTLTHYDVTSAWVNLEQILDVQTIELFGNTGVTEVVLIGLDDYQQIDRDATLEEGEMILTSYNGFMTKMMPLQAPFEITLKHSDQQFNLKAKEVNETPILNWRFTGGGMTFVVSEQLFNEIQKLNDANPTAYNIGEQMSINLIGATQEQFEVAEKLYKQLGANEIPGKSYKLESHEANLSSILHSFGTLIFTTGFLGLAFLLATGSILYFKQMSEADEEQVSYTILRKIGYSEEELLKGIILKQLFNFGVPLLIGLLHSYFAVKSGWFLFGSELTVPLIITMSLYVALYMVFALLSVRYYKQVIAKAL